MAEFRAAPTAKRYKAANDFVALKRKVWEIEHDAPFEMDDDGEDSDIAVVDEHESFNCPITTAPMTDPYTSKLCKHSYSSAVVELLRRDRDGRIECPVAGCNKYVRMSDLFKNKALAKKIERHNRKREIREAEEDDGGAVGI
ncbi:hypothetical protein DFJ73DRAFT_873865 [Zopfochytrium polystomum]|nr:hypothetical protein DFJ73DRAFT_873865 [Zopfochytrium polystomum]